MPHAYKELFEKVNASRKARGLMSLSWKQFIEKDNPTLVKTYKEEMTLHVEPDPPKVFQRPKAEYSNKSVFEKYGL